MENKTEHFNSLYQNYIEDKKFYGQTKLNQLESVYKNSVKLLFCDTESGTSIQDLIRLFSKANYRDVKLEKCDDSYLTDFWTKAIYNNVMGDYIPGVIYIGNYLVFKKHIIKILKSIDDTEYLLSSENNKNRLLKAINRYKEIH